MSYDKINLKVKSIVVVVNSQIINLLFRPLIELLPIFIIIVK